MTVIVWRHPSLSLLVDLVLRALAFNGLHRVRIDIIFINVAADPTWQQW
jgi:hypothetical protein